MLPTGRSFVHLLSLRCSSCSVVFIHRQNQCWLGFDWFDCAMVGDITLSLGSIARVMVLNTNDALSSIRRFDYVMAVNTALALSSIDLTV